MVDVVDGQLVQFSCDVVGHTGISVLVRVDPIVVHRSRCVLDVRHIVRIEPVPALRGAMSTLEADLALRLVLITTRVGDPTAIATTPDHH
jgi:hypothetical protein